MYARRFPRILNFRQRKEVEKFWEENHIFEKSMEERDMATISICFTTALRQPTESRISAMY